MKKIKLSQGKVALVDDEDYDYLMQWKWCAIKNGNTYYASRTVYLNGYKRGQRGRSKYISMHRVILNAQKGDIVDHKDHNGLNNQKTNIRVCTTSQNAMNSASYGGSRYKGVRFAITRRNGHIYTYIQARIRVNDRLINLGFFPSEEEAALAYDRAAFKYFGEFSNLNFPQKEKIETEYRKERRDA